MASSTTTPWKSSFSNQETLETKTFTWRLRPHLAHVSHQADLTTKTAKSISGSSTSRLATPIAGQTNSSSILKTSNSQHQHLEQHSQLLRFQEFEVEAGQSLGLHTMWSFFLISCGSTIPNQKSNTNISAASSSASSYPSSNSDYVGLFLRKILKSANSHQSSYTPSTPNDEIVVRYKLEIMDRDGEVLYTKDCEAYPKDKLEVGYWDWNKIVPLSKFHLTKGGKSQTRESIAVESTEESLLLLRVSFTIVNRRKSAGIGKTLPHRVPVSSEEETSTREAANAFLNLVANPKLLQPDVVIEITNRRKFLVHKKILVGRSPMFSKMLGPDKNEKYHGGVVKVDDISANTMELILKHIYTGQLEEEWTTNPVTATELIYSSEKYVLPALKEFCHKHLVRAANKNNCYRLMEVAQLHNLEKASEDLMSYVSEGISSNTNSRKNSEESIELQSH